MKSRLDSAAPFERSWLRTPLLWNTTSLCSWWKSDKLFKRILIANRGEIALRVIRTCKRLDIETVVVYSKADKDAVYLKLADRAICIGPPPAKESYLKINNIIAAAEIADVDAIHPGYGFLSENAHFAEVCRACKIAFIGPSTDVIEKLGNKIKAKEL